MPPLNLTVSKMPYKERDSFHKALRSYLKDVGPTLAERSVYLYKMWIKQAGKMLAHKDPKKVSLKEMLWLESRLTGSETTVAVKAATFRTFLRWCGNMDANKWKIAAKQRPKVDGIFLTEKQVEICRRAAESLGIEHELLLSLALDNGLRTVDMRRLTTKNAEQLLATGQSMIRSKGRRGGKMRLMVMSRATYPLLEEYMRHRGQLTDWHRKDLVDLLIREDSLRRTVVPMTYEIILRKITAISNLAGIYFRPHDGRRTFGNRHHRARTDLETIAALMGHERIDQTFRSYIGISAQEMREAQDRLSPSTMIQSVSTR
jgi:integrase